MSLSDWMAYKLSKDDLYVDQANADETHKVMDKIDNAAQNYFFSISADEAMVTKWTELIVNSSPFDRLSLGYPSYTSKGSRPNATIQFDKIYEYPWLHVAEKASGALSKFNIFDTTIDVKG